MKTDRELMELAAKAAGLKVRPYCGGLVHLDKDGLDAGWWNPLTDDGDALRLAVALNLRLHMLPIGFRSARVERLTPPWAEYVEPAHGNDCAAMRRAIVRAAAEIKERNK